MTAFDPDAAWLKYRAHATVKGSARRNLSRLGFSFDGEAGVMLGSYRIHEPTEKLKQAGLADLEGMIENGSSPRDSINLMKVAKANAFLQGRTYVTPHDVKTLAPDVLRHRLLLSYEAEADGVDPDRFIVLLLQRVALP